MLRSPCLKLHHWRWPWRLTARHAFQIFALLCIAVLFLQNAYLFFRRTNRPICKEAHAKINHSQTPDEGSGRREHIYASHFVEFLPHLKEFNRDPEANLDPLVLYRSRLVHRSPPELLIVIPTVRRPKGAVYLFDTIRSLLANLADEEKAHVQFLLFIAENDYASNVTTREYADRTVQELRANFTAYLDDDGLVEVIAPPAEWYPPDLDSTPQTFNDSSERMAWRVKQNLDYAYAMSYALAFYPHTEYYLQLEDDVITVSNYVSEIRRFAYNVDPLWITCEFSHLGFIGKLIRRGDLSTLSHYILLLYRILPVDWILDEIFRTIYCNIPPYYCQPKKLDPRLRPSRRIPLFQHVGRQSSLVGKIQELKEKKFNLYENKPIALLALGNPLPVGIGGSLAVNASNSPNDTSPASFYTHGKPIRLSRQHMDHTLTLHYIDNQPTLTHLELHYTVKLTKEVNTRRVAATIRPLVTVLLNEVGQPAGDMRIRVKDLANQASAPFLFSHTFPSPVQLHEIGITIVVGSNTGSSNRSRVGVNSSLRVESLDYVQLSFIRIK